MLLAVLGTAGGGELACTNPGTFTGRLMKLKTFYIGYMIVITLALIIFAIIVL